MDSRRINIDSRSVRCRILCSLRMESSILRRIERMLRWKIGEGITSVVRCSSRIVILQSFLLCRIIVTRRRRDPRLRSSSIKLGIERASKLLLLLQSDRIGVLLLRRSCRLSSGRLRVCVGVLSGELDLGRESVDNSSCVFDSSIEVWPAISLQLESVDQPVVQCISNLQGEFEESRTDQSDSSILAAAGQFSGPPCSHAGTASICSRSTAEESQHHCRGRTEMRRTSRKILARRSSFEDQIRSIFVLQCSIHQHQVDGKGERTNSHFGNLATDVKESQRRLVLNSSESIQIRLQIRIVVADSSSFLHLETFDDISMKRVTDLSLHRS